MCFSLPHNSFQIPFSEIRPVTYNDLFYAAASSSRAVCPSHENQTLVRTFSLLPARGTSSLPSHRPLAGAVTMAPAPPAGDTGDHVHGPCVSVTHSHQDTWEVPKRLGKKETGGDKHRRAGRPWFQPSPWYREAIVFLKLPESSGMPRTVAVLLDFRLPFPSGFLPS